MEVSMFGQTIDFLKYIKPYLPQIHNWIRGMVYILLIYYNYKQVIKLIRGTEPIVTSYEVTKS